MNHRYTFRSLSDITIDLFTSEDRYFPWITTAPLFIMPTTFGIAHARVTLARYRSPNLRPECQIIATRQLDALTVPLTHYISNNFIHFQSHLLNGTNPIPIDLLTMKDYFPSIGHQHSAISSCWLLWLPVIHVLQKIYRIKMSVRFISTFGRNSRTIGIFRACHGISRNI